MLDLHSQGVYDLHMDLDDYFDDDTDYDLYEAAYEDFGMEDYEPSPYDGTYSED